MKQPIALLILAASLALAGCWKDNLSIAKDGKAQAAIALPDNPTDAEKRAAAELKEHLDLISGADFKIVPASSLEKDARAIHVGNTPQAKAALGSFNSKTAPYDSIRIKSDANALYINGHERHGAYYAACEFLEETLGARWWTPDETYLPKSPDIKIGAIDLSYAPKFEMRRSGYIKSLRTVWRPRMRSSVFATPKDAVSEELSDSYVVGCHSYYKILPPEKYFEKHPEWYSWDAKKKARFHDRGQLCRSNPAMAEEFAKNVLQKLRKNPNKKYVHVSQNDWGGDCQCEKCEALKTKFGGEESGINIWFANKIAAKIYEEFPGARVVTFAYHQTRRPPENIKPAENVFVELCSIECDFAHTLESDTEFGFTDDLKKWSAITNNLFIWNYVACFWNYAIPHPNMGGLDADLRFFAANGGRGIYEQGDSQCNVGNF
ncbi:MAG: DUF4838 domain-containing protein, partial [Opitutales bacterium]|nr:DUF4838 domain-containing protein [Opitutales bacterium]